MSTKYVFCLASNKRSQVDFDAGFVDAAAAYDDAAVAMVMP